VSNKPVLPADVREFYLPADGDVRELMPVLYGSARIHYTDSRRGIDTVNDLNVTVPFAEGAVAIDWERAEPCDATPEDLAAEPPPSGAAISYRSLPAAGMDPRRYTAWSKDFERWVLRAERLTLFAVPSLKLTSNAGEREHEFRQRVMLAQREARDAAVERLRARHAPKLARLTQRLGAAGDAVAREEQQASQQKTQTMVSFGATVIGALFGRKAVSLSTLGRATTAARGVGRAIKETQDVARAQEERSETERELKALEAQIQEEIEALGAPGSAPLALDTIEIKPKRGGVDLRLVALAWKPLS
jgi:hypothetical protein